MATVERRKYPAISTTDGATEHPFETRGSYKLTMTRVDGHRLSPVFVSKDGTEGRVLGDGTLDLSDESELEAYKQEGRTRRQKEWRALQVRRLRALRAWATGREPGD